METSQSDGCGHKTTNHTEARRQKEPASTKFINKEADTSSGDDVNSTKDQVDGQDGVTISDADQCKNLKLSAVSAYATIKRKSSTYLGQEIRHNAVAGPLRKEANGDQDD